MDIYNESRIEFEVEKLVNFIIATSEHGKTKTEIINAIKQNHKDYIIFP